MRPEEVMNSTEMQETKMWKLGTLGLGDINQVLDPKEQSAIRIYYTIPSGVSLLLHEMLARHPPKRL